MSRQKGGTDIEAFNLWGWWCLLLGVIVAISSAFAWDGLPSELTPKEMNLDRRVEVFLHNFVREKLSKRIPANHFGLLCSCILGPTEGKIDPNASFRKRQNSLVSDTLHRKAGPPSALSPTPRTVSLYVQQEHCLLAFV